MWQSWQSKGVATRQRRARQKFLGGCCRLYNCLPVPEEENEDLSAPLHMYFVLPNPILPSRFGQERFFEAVIKGSAHNNYTHTEYFCLADNIGYFFGSGFAICLLHCWPSICWVSTLPNNSSVVPEWSFLLLSPSVWAFVSPLCLCVYFQFAVEAITSAHLYSHASVV